jgi:CTP:molybdopterin cytidylyltransferase MocA
MGRSKPLLPLGDKPVVRHCLETLLHGGVDEVILVVGLCGEAVVKAVVDLPVTIVRNPDPESEMADSVRCGLKAVSDSSDAVMVALVDHPLVKPATLRALLEHYARNSADIVLPTYRGRCGHPTLFSKDVLEEIRLLSTLHEIVKREPERVKTVPVQDTGVLIDMDTLKDYQKVLQFWHRPPGLSHSLQRTGLE